MLPNLCLSSSIIFFLNKSKLNLYYKINKTSEFFFDLNFGSVNNIAVDILESPKISIKQEKRKKKKEKEKKKIKLKEFILY